MENEAANVQKKKTIVVKNPLAPVEHKGGAGIKNELFERGLDQFIRGMM